MKREEGKGKVKHRVLTYWNEKCRKHCSTNWTRPWRCIGSCFLKSLFFWRILDETFEFIWVHRDNRSSGIDPFFIPWIDVHYRIVFVYNNFSTRTFFLLKWPSKSHVKNQLLIVTSTRYLGSEILSGISNEILKTHFKKRDLRSATCNITWG